MLGSGSRVLLARFHCWYRTGPSRRPVLCPTQIAQIVTSIPSFAMPLAVTPAEINTLAKKAAHAVDYELLAVFWREASVPDIGADRRDALQLIAFVLGPSTNLLTQDGRQPFGKPASGQSPHDLANEQIASLAEIAPAIESPEIRAILRDIAWLRLRGDPDLARSAVADYLSNARNLESPKEWCEGVARAERAVRLGRSLGADDPSFSGSPPIISLSWRENTRVKTPCF